MSAEALQSLFLVNSDVKKGVLDPLSTPPALQIYAQYSTKKEFTLKRVD